jgi:hypothetical protein
VSLEKTCHVEENLFGLLRTASALSVLLLVGPRKRDKNLRWLGPKKWSVH